MEAKKVYNHFCIDAIRSLTALRHQAEQLVISSGCIDTIDRSNEEPFLWKSLQPQEHFVLSLVPKIQEVSADPELRLGGLLEDIQRNLFPKELQMQGLTVQMEGNMAHFCISGSISLDNLNTLCEHYSSCLHHRQKK